MKAEERSTEKYPPRIKVKRGKRRIFGEKTDRDKKDILYRL